MTRPPAAQNHVETIRFIRQGKVVTLGNVPPSRTLLELLREDLALTGRAAAKATAATAPWCWAKW